MKMRAHLILTVCIVFIKSTYFELKSVHMAYHQAVNRKIGESKIQENFQNLFNSIVNENVNKSEIYHGILEQEEAKERQTFDSMKEELWIRRNRNAHQMKNFFKKNYINEKVLAVKRETKENDTKHDPSAVLPEGSFEYKFRTCAYVKEVNNVTVFPEPRFHVCSLPVEEKTRICRSALVEEFCETHRIEYRDDVAWGEKKFYEVFLNGVFYRGKRHPFIVSACICPTAPPMYLRDASNGTDVKFYVDLHVGEDEFGFTVPWKNISNDDPNKPKWGEYRWL